MRSLESRTKIILLPSFTFYFAFTLLSLCNLSLNLVLLSNSSQVMQMEDLVCLICSGNGYFLEGAKMRSKKGPQKNDKSKGEVPAFVDCGTSVDGEKNSS
jgi:hypothetical protein